MAAGSARLLRPLILRDLLVALENAEIHNERLTGQCFLDPKSQKEEAPVPQPALKLQKNCCAAQWDLPRRSDDIPKGPMAITEDDYLSDQQTSVSENRRQNGHLASRMGSYYSCNEVATLI